ncbi:divalent-cation tolerance protein CutA [bacterium]|nr:divalent-cation tolerance protein CutA [bacterium]
MEAIVIYITASSEKEAQHLSDVLLDNKAVACVNIVPNVQSNYWWKGNKEKASELLLIAKTRKTLLNKVVELIKANHSYDVPEVIAIPIVGGNLDYLNWIDEETGE